MMDPRHNNNGYAIPPHAQMPQMPGVAQPVYNPPQIFRPTSYGPDGLPNLGLADLGQNFLPDPSLMDESIEAKRRRIARACDMCRKKKIKCDGKLPECTHCANYHTQCVFTQVEKKRSTPKGAQYIASLENRLTRMESLLKLGGLLTEEEDTDLGTLEKTLLEKRESMRASQQPGSNPASPTEAANEENSSTPRSHLASPEPQNKGTPKNAEKRKSGSPEEAKPKEEEVEELSDMMCSLVTNNCGETRYIGSSSGFSIFSPKGIQWVNQKTGDSSFQEMISSASVDDNKWMYWKPEVFGDLFQRPIFKRLPPKNECLSLLKDFFENFNCMFPLFHQPTFMYLAEKQYSDDPYEGSGWWASLNVALAIAHRLRVLSNLVPKEEDDKAWGYMKNAMGVMTELTLRNTDLLSVQALLGMASFLQGTPNPQPTFFLVAAAIRLSHSIGLHKRGSGFNLNPVEIEQRKRVFWIAYLLDKDICLRSGRPPAQDDDDMNVDLPAADPDDGIGNIPLADGKGKVNLFRLMVEFATIESKVYKRLYSTRASKQSDGELLYTIGELDHLLEEWKDSIPVDFRPEHEIKASHTPMILHIVILHFAYYNCLTTIHRMSIHHGYWTSRLSNYAIQGLNAKPLNPRVFSSAALCVSAARATIALIQMVPQGDFACVWLILYFPVSALVTLFGNILQNPQDPRARADVKLMGTVVNFLTVLGTDDENGGVKRMLGVCSEFERIAKVVLDKADKESSSRRKRKNNTDDQTAKTKAPMVSMAAQASMTAQTPLIGGFSPAMSQLNGYSPMPTTANTNGAPTNGSSPNWNAPNFHGSEYMSPNPFPEGIEAYNAAMDQAIANGDDISNMQSPPMNGLVQQPYVPQDLWQMPMSLEWDWAEMSGGQYPSFENGIVGDLNLGNLGGGDNAHLQHQGGI